MTSSKCYQKNVKQSIDLIAFFPHLSMFVYTFNSTSHPPNILA